MLLVAETAFTTGDIATAVPLPGPGALTAKAPQPSKADILKADVEWAAKHARGSKAWAILQAKKTGKKVVAYDETTATSYTVANPDGTLTTELTSGPERVWRNGTWHKADATLTADAKGNVTAKYHPNGLRLAGKGGTVPTSLRAAQDDTARDLVTLGSGDEQVTLQWKGGLPAPQLNGTTARYPDAVPGADVIVEATRTGFEQFVEIGRKPGAGGYSYTLPVKAKGLKAKANKDGSVTFTDVRTGAARATMPAPVMWDATTDKRSGEHTRRARVGMKVVNKGSGAVDLIVTPDATFLADPETRYPVTVDPSTSGLSNTFDTYVQQGETVDLSTDTELDLGNPGTKNADGTPRTARSFVTWNTTPIQDALILDTNLALWNFHSGNTDCTAQGWTVWDTGVPSTSSRWTAQPAWTKQYHSSTETKGNPDCASQPDGWINADVDGLVQTWAANKATRGHMGLRAASDDVKAWKRVNSANNTANQPKLTVTYNYRPETGTAQQAGAPFKSYAGVWAVNTTTPTLRDKFADKDGDLVDGTFQIYDAATNTPITTPAGDGVIVSPFVKPGEWAGAVVPAGQLKDGKTYKFRSSPYDGTHYNTEWSPWVQFVVDTAAPGEPSPVTSTRYPEGSYGGGAGQAGTWTATTADDANRLQYRVDGEDADADSGAAGRGTWSTVNTTSTSSGTTGSFSATPAADGAHHVETRAVDRADNVGTTDEYGFVAGSAPASRSHKVDITLNSPDKSAVDPADWNNPYPAFGWSGWDTLTSSGAIQQDAPALLSPKKRVTKAGDVTLTMTPQKQRSPQAAKALKKYQRQLAQQKRTNTAPLGASSYTGPVLDPSWCDPTKINQKSFIRRTEACLLFTWGAEGTSDKGIYRQYWDVMWQVKLDPKGDGIKTFVQMYPLMPTVQEQWPSSPKAMAFNVITGCAGSGCTSGMGFDWQSGRTPSWSSGLDNHLAQGTADFKWDGSVNTPAGLKDQDLSKVLTLGVGASFTTDTPNMVVTQDKVSSGGFNVRCDKVYSDPGGCVVPSYSPGYSMNAKKFPAAAAHAWLVQSKLAPEYFGRTPVTPLHYLPGRSPKDKTKFRNAAGAGNTGRSENANRYRICYGAAANKMVYRPDTALHPELSSSNKDSRSCDEYSFNSTYESAGMPKSEGGLNPKPVSDASQGRDCVQTYETKLPDGTFRLYDDERFNAPAWEETCGRSSMSLNANSQSMARFGSFASTFRLIDKDTYWVDIDGFQNCDALADTVTCAQRP